MDMGDDEAGREGVMTAGMWRYTDSELMAAIADDAQAMFHAEIASLRKIAELVSRDTALGSVTTLADHLSVNSTLTLPKARAVVTFAVRMQEHPRVFAAVRDGDITKAAATMIVKFIDDPPSAMPEEAVDRAEQVLIDYARTSGRTKLTAMIDGIRDHYIEPPGGSSSVDRRAQTGRGDDPTGDGGAGNAGDGASGKEPPSYDGRRTGMRGYGRCRPESRGSDDTERNTLFVSRTLGGRYALRGDLDSETGERLVVALSPLSAPRPEHDGTRDRRSAARRRADGLAEFLRRHAQCSGAVGDEGDDEGGASGHAVPPTADAERGAFRKAPRHRSTRASGRAVGTGGCGQPPTGTHDLGGGTGTGTTLNLHVRLRDLADTDDDVAARSELIADGRFEDVFDNLPHGMTDWFATVTVGAARRLACDAAVTPVGVDSHGVPLNLGRSRRLASRSQRRALAARDHGCAFPRCDRPPAWCIAHHVWHWVDGGPTDLDNLVSLCGEHHRAVHHHGWTVAFDTAARLPRFLPPAQGRMSHQWLDSDGAPAEPPHRADAEPHRSRPTAVP